MAIFEWQGVDNQADPSELLYSYQVDGAAWSDASPDTAAYLPGLNDGPHTFSVRAEDPVSNVETSFPTINFTNDCQVAFLCCCLYSKTP